MKIKLSQRNILFLDWKPKAVTCPHFQFVWKLCSRALDKTLMKKTHTIERFTCWLLYPFTRTECSLAIHRHNIISAFKFLGGERTEGLLLGLGWYGTRAVTQEIWIFFLLEFAFVDFFVRHLRIKTFRGTSERNDMSCMPIGIQPFIVVASRTNWGVVGDLISWLQSMWCFQVRCTFWTCP